MDDEFTDDQQSMDYGTKPEYRSQYQVNPALRAHNGGESDRVTLYLEQNPVIDILWQSGPRNEPESFPGAFVEDVIWAALQRLEYFNSGDMRDRRNSMAITHLEQALWALNDRKLDREHRGILGKNEV